MGEMPDLARGRKLELRYQILLDTGVPRRVEMPQVHEVLGEREAPRQVLALRYVSDSLEILRCELARWRAEHGDVAAVGAQDVHQHADGRGLAGAIGADQREHGAFRHAQAQVLDGFESPKPFGDVIRLDDHLPLPTTTALSPRSSVQVSSTACCTSPR